MRASAALTRWSAVAVAGVLLAVALVVTPPRSTPSAHGDETKKSSGDWTMYGGTPDRNFVNTRQKNIPEKWDVDNGTNIKWAIELGSKAYGGPVVSGGKVFVGTNNNNPRDPAIKGDKGIV